MTGGGKREGGAVGGQHEVEDGGHLAGLEVHDLAVEPVEDGGRVCESERVGAKRAAEPSHHDRSSEPRPDDIAHDGAGGAARQQERVETIAADPAARAGTNRLANLMPSTSGIQFGRRRHPKFTCPRTRRMPPLSAAYPSSACSTIGPSGARTGSAVPPEGRNGDARLGTDSSRGGPSTRYVAVALPWPCLERAYKSANRDDQRCEPLGQNLDLAGTTGCDQERRPHKFQIPKLNTGVRFSSSAPSG